MSRQISLPALQPNQRRTARKVSRASSSPASTAARPRSRFDHASEHLGRVAGVADRRGREGQQLVAAELLGLPAARRPPRSTSASAPSAPDRRRCRCARPAAARSCATAAASAGRRGARRPPAGARCSSPRPAHRAAFDDATVMTAPDRREPSRRSQSRGMTYADAWHRARPPRSGSTSRASGSSSPTRPMPSTAIRADLTWLCSRWTCIFGRGCHGIIAGRADDGLLQPRRVLLRQGRREAGPQASPSELTPDDWQFYDRAPRRGKKAKLGSRSRTSRRRRDRGRKTRIVDGACIFPNRAGLPGGTGCALHALALRTGRQPAGDQAGGVLAAAGAPRAGLGRPAGRHPDPACRRSTEFDRRGWGEGGHDLDWYCTSSPEAHVGGEPLYVSYGPELTALLGRPAYDELARLCAAPARARPGRGAPRDGRRRSSDPLELRPTGGTNAPDLSSGSNL